MVDTAGGRATPVDGGLQAGNRQAGVDPSADGVADDPARPGVKDDGDVDEAGRDRDIGNVRHPELVRAGEGHVPGSIGEDRAIVIAVRRRNVAAPDLRLRSEEHTSELQSLMRTSYAVFCLKKKNQIKH